MARTALERLAGRKGGPELSLGQMQERFSFLKGAPVESFAKDVLNLNIQPVGHVVRNVRCRRCQGWGHDASDRECPQFAAPASQADLAKLVALDPMAALLAGSSSRRGSSRGRRSPRRCRRACAT